jgi:hypothetical protein
MDVPIKIRIMIHWSLYACEPILAINVEYEGRRFYSCGSYSKLPQDMAKQLIIKISLKL